MSDLKLADIDMNLLVVLSKLLESRSVTKAANTLGVTQPAVTQNLKRLRVLFKDPLLVRTRYGMEPTPFAIELAPPLKKILDGVRTLLDPRKFDPISASMTFRMEMDDYSQLLLLPEISERLRLRAPNIRLAVHAPSPTPPIARLENRDLQIAIGSDRNFVGEFRRKRLLTDRLVCLVRRGHPTLESDGKISLDQFVALPHVSVSPSPMVSKLVDDVLAAMNGAREIRTWLPTIVPAAVLACRSDQILVVQARAATLMAGLFGGVVVECPIPLSDYTVYQVWHGTTDSEPSSQWMRTLISEAARDMEMPTPAN
jgi:DNA-binding transcriptional LysR family regulator